MLKWLGGLFVDSNDKALKRLLPDVDRINTLEPEFEKLSDSQLRAKTGELKERLNSGDSLDDLLPEAFAIVREAAKRTIGQRHFDVQLMGGIVLHQGKIAEMKTGEGKTLVATLPLYLNTLSGQGCHLVTVNDYLAKWQHQWMGTIYDILGITVASIQHDAAFIYDADYQADDAKWNLLRPVTRREAYAADITYGTNNEFGFDYLRDNMAIDHEQCVQRGLNYAIVDEVDNILIDEARTPLIISGQAEEAGQNYQKFSRLVPRLREDVDYTVDEKSRAVQLTDAGITTVESYLKRDGLLQAPNLYDPANYPLTRYLDSSLKANVLYKRDRDYVVSDGQVIIVDEFTGRMMPGRRYSEGLHQSLEAKEKVKVQRESMTYATITYQNYFRMYHKLAGMTGTALTEAEEFHKIYQLEVVVIETNEPMIRQDNDDHIYKDEKSKYRAVVNEVEEHHKLKQPVLIGTVSIEKSEILSDLLKRKGIKHEVLNAKYHEREAGIIAQAGRLSAVTVATNMAGRGVDIILGGNPSGRDDNQWQQEHDSVVGLGGLHIVGTERHEARRIDNQLRGRAGRQGDAGSSRFYVSLEDDIVRRFGGDRVKGVMEWAGMGEDTPIENKLINRSIEGAQVRVEGYHFDIRKHLVEYDDVINKQRELIYEERNKILSGTDLRENILNMVSEEIGSAVATHSVDEYGDQGDQESLIAEVSAIFPISPGLQSDLLNSLKPTEIEQKLAEYAATLYDQRENDLGPENIRMLERVIMLRTIDSLWVEHLTTMEHMRQEANWQSLRQVKPVDAYKKEGYAQFQVLLDTIRHDVVRIIFHADISKTAAPRRARPALVQASSGASAVGTAERPKVTGKKKIGRNEPCPCGSGKKYKHCCGK